MIAFSIACMTKPISFMTWSSAISSPINACKKPTRTTNSNKKKIKLSRNMTFNTTSMAPKKRNVSKYSSRRIQNMGAVKARKL